MKKEPKHKKRNSKLLRKHRVCISFNEKELKVINKFCRKYKIKNKSQFFREAIIKAIIEKMVDDDYPKLFENFPLNFTSQQTQDNFSKQEEQQKSVQEINPPKLF